MKEGWNLKKIKEVADVFAGQGAPQGDSNYCLNGIPFVKAGNLSELINGKPESSIQNVSEQVAKTHKLKLYKAGSVLFAKSGMSCMKGYVYTLKKDCYVVSHLAIITPISIDSHFLNYYLCFNKPNTLIKDSAYPSISLKDIENLKIPVPTFSEQQHIVEELDLLSSIIEKKKEQLKELDNLAQSIFYDMFGDPAVNEKGWDVKEMETLCSHIVDCPHSTPKKADRITQYPCIRTSELKQGDIFWDSMQYLEKEEYLNRITRLKPHTGDIVFGREGTIGDAVILPKGYSFCLGQRTMLLRVNEAMVNNRFLQRTILSEWVKKQIRAVNVSSTVPHVNIKDFKSFDIPLPPLPLQQQFASKIETIERQKELVKQSIKEVETLFNSRMDYYFN